MVPGYPEIRCSSTVVHCGIKVSFWLRLSLFLKDLYTGTDVLQRDFQNMSVDHEKEIKGTKDFAPASFPHYLPVWDNEKGQKYVKVS